jgi:hypothetical protein
MHLNGVPIDEHLSLLFLFRTNTCLLGNMRDSTSKFAPSKVACTVQVIFLPYILVDMNTTSDEIQHINCLSQKPFFPSTTAAATSYCHEIFFPMEDAKADSVRHAMSATNTPGQEGAHTVCRIRKLPSSNRSGPPMTPLGIQTCSQTQLPRAHVHRLEPQPTRACSARKTGRPAAAHIGFSDPSQFKDAAAWLRRRLRWGLTGRRQHCITLRACVHGPIPRPDHLSNGTGADLQCRVRSSCTHRIGESLFRGFFLLSAEKRKGKQEEKCVLVICSHLSFMRVNS